MKDNKSNKQLSNKILFFLFLPFFFIFFVAIFNYYQDPYKIFKNNFSIDDYLKKPIRISERELKYQLIIKNNFDSYLFGSSSSTTLDLTENKNNFINASFEGPKIEEIIQYTDYILKHKKPKKIFFELRYYMFTDYNFYPEIAYQLEKNFIYKFYRLIDFHITKESFKKFIEVKSFRYLINKELQNKDIQNISELEKKRISLGIRHYTSRPNQLINEKEFLKRIELLKKIPIDSDYIKEEMNEKKIKKFILKLNELDQKNIEYKIFFSPTTIKAQNIKNNTLRKQELSLIKRLIENKKELEIYYFNKKNEQTSNYNNFHDHFHYYYDLANKIRDELLLNDKNKLKYSIIINNNNYLNSNIIQD